MAAAVRPRLPVHYSSFQLVADRIRGCAARCQDSRHCPGRVQSDLPLSPRRHVSRCFVHPARFDATETTESYVSGDEVVVYAGARRLLDLLRKSDEDSGDFRFEVDTIRIADHRSNRATADVLSQESDQLCPSHVREFRLMRKLWIGTSGWTYKGWRGSFYPSDVPMKNWLRWYATQFPTAEINGSFYRTPSLEAVKAWRDQTPEHFVFAWKASKFITHWKRLTDKCRNSLSLMETRLEVLEPKVGPVLFQLPPRFTINTERLGSFLKLLNKKRQYVFEFRDPSWYEPRALDLLRNHNVALCLSDHHDAPAPWEVTAQHVYVRGHGPTGQYKDRYPKRTLDRWADAFAVWRRKRLTVYCYFDNDQKTAAPKDAQRLIDICETAKK